MMAAFETARGPFPRAKPIAVNAGLAALGIPGLNELRLQLGWGAFAPDAAPTSARWSRRGFVLSPTRR